MRGSSHDIMLRRHCVRLHAHPHLYFKSLSQIVVTKKLHSVVGPQWQNTFSGWLLPTSKSHTHPNNLTDHSSKHDGSNHHATSSPPNLQRDFPNQQLSEWPLFPHNHHDRFVNNETDLPYTITELTILLISSRVKPSGLVTKVSFTIVVEGKCTRAISIRLTLVVLYRHHWAYGNTEWDRKKVGRLEETEDTD